MITFFKQQQKYFKHMIDCSSHYLCELSWVRPSGQANVETYLSSNNVLACLTQLGKIMILKTSSQMFSLPWPWSWPLALSGKNKIQIEPFTFLKWPDGLWYPVDHWTIQLCKIYVGTGFPESWVFSHCYVERRKTDVTTLHLRQEINFIGLGQWCFPNAKTWIAFEIQEHI